MFASSSLPWHLIFASFISLDSHVASATSFTRNTLPSFSSLILVPSFLLVVILGLLMGSNCQHTLVEKNIWHWGFQSDGLINFPFSFSSLCSGTLTFHPQDDQSPFNFLFPVVGPRTRKEEVKLPSSGSNTGLCDNLWLRPLKCSFPSRKLHRMLTFNTK